MLLTETSCEHIILFFAFAKWIAQAEIPIAVIARLLRRAVFDRIGRGFL